MGKFLASCGLIEVSLNHDLGMVIVLKMELNIKMEFQVNIEFHISYPQGCQEICQHPWDLDVFYHEPYML